MYQCDHRVISDVRRIEEIMVGAAKHAKAHIVDVVFHNFSPNGISGMIVISESHLSIHTWPEYDFASVDIYTCGSKVNPWRAYEYIHKNFKSKNVTAMEFKRGLFPAGKRTAKLG